jgi:hypothetical protein
MECDCPIISHLFNTLNHEYHQAEQGTAHSERIASIESFFQILNSSKPYPGITHDPAYLQIRDKIRKIEHDDVLKFEEKAALKKRLRKEQDALISTKSRIYHLNYFVVRSQLWKQNFVTTLHGFKANPLEQGIGLIVRYPIGVVRWFINMIRNNIGYSVAMAIYSPFTFYFITQPMNPHAMWAVGKIRNTYLSATHYVAALPIINHFTHENDHNIKSDTQTEKTSTGDHNVSATPYDKVKTRHEGIILSTDVPEVDGQTWEDRMTNFKTVQATYESNMQFAARMGRLEQMELQLNFPLIVESAYREMENYQHRLAKIKSLLENSHQNNADNLAYLAHEEQRTRQFKLYIWDKLVRYMFDHPYTVMDESEEQKYVDYYMGRSFIFLKEITESLSKEYKDFQIPKNFKGIETLAKLYKDKYVPAPTIEERLSKNSIIHQQKNFYDGKELRSYMQRQWEILYLMQNKTQEASNFGLQMYVWSVRNAIWVLNTLYAQKNHELDVIADYIDSSIKNKNTPWPNETQTRIEPLYESLIHILTLEYVSVRPEINDKLTNDVETTQRKTVIDSINASFKERTGFINRLKQHSQ